MKGFTGLLAGARRHWRIVLVCLAAVLLVGARWWAVPLLKRMEYFRVRHVEVRGTKLADPAALLRVLRVDSTLSLWDDHRALEERLRALPYLVDARVVRRPPGTLVVSVREREPVAFLSTGTGMVPLDARGQELPFDPLRTELDLPIVARRDTALLRLLEEVRTSEPAVFARISEARREGRDEVVLLLKSLSVRVRTDVAPARLGAILSVEADLARKGLQPAELDLRFRDQIVAKLP
jgi:cell division protein FtsQ